jgi:crotonobetainyl-CoA:carnitine CoA-transferase CaiB-like acyl-CoA transferase
MPATVFEGVNVLELGNAMVPALAGMMLADNGARVVKVEPPGGDSMRQTWPSGFVVWNRGKGSLVADLRTAAGRALVTGLLDRVDVVLVAFAPGTARRFGVDGAAVAGRHPGLIHCSVTAFGQHGPYAGLNGYEGIVAAKAGAFHQWRDTFRPGPIFTGAYRASAGAAFLAVQGVAAALVARDRTGRGQLVETSLYQGLTAFDPFGLALVQSETTASEPALHHTSVSGGTYCTADGRWLLFTNMLPHQHRAFLEVLGLGSRLRDDRFSGYPHVPDAAAADELGRDIWAGVRSRTLAEWLPILHDAPDVAFELAASSEEGLDHPQIRHNGTVVTIDDPTFGPVEQVGPLAAFERTRSVIAKPAPALGEADPFPDRAPRPPPADAAQAGPPFAGLTIVELGSFFAMPFGTALLAALGARVVKVEDPNGGDPMRNAFGPPAVAGAKVCEGKESLAVDLKTVEGAEIVRRLLARADMFVVGLRPGAAERLALGREDLREINPGLSYVNIAGYGTDGPYARRATYGPMNAAVAGGMHRFAGYWLDPALARSEEDLAHIAVHLVQHGDTGDPCSALGAATALAMTALAHSRGVTQSVVNTQIASNAYAFSDDFNRYAGKRPYPEADPGHFGLSAAYRLYPARRGWVFLACVTDTQWKALLAAVGRDDLAALDRDADNATLVAALQEVFACDDATAWEKRLTPLGIGCVEVFEGSFSEFACYDQWLRDAGMTVQVEHPELGTRWRHGPAVTFSESTNVVKAGCRLGQHTESILRELAFTPKQIRALRSEGTVTW